MRHVVAVGVLGALIGGLVASAPTAPLEQALRPVDAVIDTVGTAAGACDDLDVRMCLFPFPNDHFTALDASTPTGRRVDLNPLATPRNVVGKPIDPTEWNRNDGFSPGAMMLTVVPGLDLTATFGLDPDPETGVGTDNDPWAVRDEIPDAVLEDPALSMMPDAPIVLLDADTGTRHPYWAELDEHPETLDAGEDRTLIIRPLVNLREGARYIVALRDLRDADGSLLAPGPAFHDLVDAHAPPPSAGPATPGGKLPCAAHPGGGTDRGRGVGQDRRCDDDAPMPGFPPPADIDPADRGARYADIFTRLQAIGVPADTLHLAWDFHVASAENLAGRALHIRDDAFRQLGDTNLADLVVAGGSPPFTVTDVIDHDNGERTVHGEITVPNYLTLPQDPVIEIPAAGVPVVLPQSRFVHESPVPGPMDLPVQNPLVPTMTAEFTCRFRTNVSPGTLRPTLYGHGLLGSRGEVTGGSTADLRGAGHAMCAVDWNGMATEDITNVALILHDMSFFPSLADRVQQGFLGFHLLGRALIHPDGLATHPAFARADGSSLLDTGELFYNGNSQGGIMGAPVTAMSPDLTKSVLGVPGSNYSTLLNRSVDWEGEYLTDRLQELDPSWFDNPQRALPAYASFAYTAYPDKVAQQLMFAMIQMLWDRAEGNGYSQHLTDDPYPNTPPHQVLFEVALGDYQVANVAAEVQARTAGADFLGTALLPHRHWERPYALGFAPAPYLFDDFVPDDGGVRHAASGSAIVYWDSCNPVPFNGNVPPADLHQDPHSDPRRAPKALEQKVHFYRTGQIIDVNDGRPNWTRVCRHPDRFPGWPNITP